MAIVISRTGDISPEIPSVTPEQREALWAAFVTSWLDKNKDRFQAMLATEEVASA